MDSIFGIGLPELVFILLLAGLVMGPQRIRKVARTLGLLVAKVQLLSNQFRQQLNTELDALDSDEVRGAISEMKDLQRQLTELRKQVTELPREATKPGRQAVSEARQALRVNPARIAEQSASESTVESPPPAPTLPTPIDVPDDPE